MLPSRHSDRSRVPRRKIADQPVGFVFGFATGVVLVDFIEGAAGHEGHEEGEAE